MKRLLLILFTFTTIALFAQPKVVALRGFYRIGDSEENTTSSMANAQKLSVDDVEFDILDQFELISFSEHACKEFICLALNNTIINVSSDLWTDKTPEVLKAEGYNGLSLNLNVFLNRPDLVDEANKLRLASTLCSVKNNEMKD